jgi:predicted alpha/beta superfamily hydrolase
MIVVGIGKQIRSYDAWWPVRGRDYSPMTFPNQESSGQAAAFLDCVRSEVLPLIDRAFHTDLTSRTLWGHSLGGAFALYTLLQDSTLFHRYIATSPAIVEQGQQLIDIETRAPSQGALLDAHLFISVGSLDQGYKRYIETFSVALRSRNYGGLLFTTAILEGYAHIAAGPPGFIEGLRAVFSD